MAFKTFAYNANDGEIYKIRLTDVTAGAGGFTSQTGFTSEVYAKVSKSNREFGIRPRGVRVSRMDGNAKVYRFLPVATPAALEAILAAGNVNIGGEGWNVTTSVAEDY
jgi:hypothetical protein